VQGGIMERTEYEISSNMEECSCKTCGCPLYVGDTVFEGDLEQFCGNKCRNFYQAKEEGRR
jgi:hypothetical protein